MSGIWWVNLLVIVGVVLVLVVLYDSLHRLGQPERVFFSAYGRDEAAANEAWSEHRDAEAFEAVRLSGDDWGDLLVLDNWSKGV